MVEDDQNIQEIECYALKSNGYDVHAFSDSESFNSAMKSILPDLILLDIMLPGEDGLSILRRLRADRMSEKIPVMMVTAKTSEMDTVKALDQGADDYICKPFGVMELLSRVKALLRRVHLEEESTVLKYKNITMEKDRRVVSVDGEVIELTYKEYELLKTLLSNVGMVLTRDILMNTVWDADYAGESRTIDMHIKTLRKKLKEAGSLILTVRNVGYKLE